MESTEIEVGSEQGGQRLDRFLADALSISRARVRHLLEVGRIESGGRTLSESDKSHRTNAGERFKVAGSIQVADEVPISRPDLPLAVVDQGVGWVVVNKPVGCGVHPLRPDEDTAVLNALIARSPEILGVGEGGLRSGVVHRLDVDTTGALLFAKDADHWKRFRGAFSEHRVRKRYLAIVAGRFEKRRRLDVRLEVARHKPAHVKVVEVGGTACRQRVVSKRLFAEATLVEVQLETGFLHQIRATLAHLGHPVLGDTEYGGVAEDGGPLVAGCTAPRPLLHAASLSIDEINAWVDPPADFEAALSVLAELSAVSGESLADRIHR